MGDLSRLTPELLLLAGALAALFVRGRTSAWIGVVATTLAAAGAVVLGTGATLFGGMLELDASAVFARVAIAGLTGIWLLWLAGRGTGAERPAEAVSLALISALGGMVMVSARDLVVLFLAVELSTMPAYVLAGYRRADARGLEGALKYFLLSMLTSLVMLYGFSFLYGLSGATGYAALGLGGPALLRDLAFAFVLVGFFAKLSAAPFHYWTPDAYAGAPAAAVAFVSTVPKVAGTVALMALARVLAPTTPDATLILIVASVASMLLGNLAALTQTDLRRLMAYSGVAHTGYVLLGLASGAAGGTAAVFYAVAYAAPSMAILLMGAEEGTAIEDLGGLAARRPALAWGAVAWLLSLVGIPPLVGFFGKLYLFTAAVEAGWLWAVLVAVAMAVVSAGYYFRVVRAAFFAEALDAPMVARSAPATVSFALATIAVLALGVFASPLWRFFGVSP